MLLAIICLPILLCSLLVLAVARSRGKGRQVSLMTWNELVAQLQPVQTEGITALALDHLELDRPHEERDHDEIWGLIGGVDGLTRMRNNSNVFIALASYALRTGHEEGMMIAARIRRDDLALRRAVVGLAVGKTLGYGRSRISLYVQEAASSYYLMRKRLLSLYRANQPALYPVLGQHLEEACLGKK